MRMLQASTALLGLAIVAGCASTQTHSEEAAAAAPAPASTTAATPQTTPAASPETPAAAPPPQVAPAPALDFAGWLKAFARQARDAGISEETLAQTLEQAQWLPRVVELDRAQPEFVRPPWVYLDNAVSSLRITQGRKQMQLHAPALQAASERYGVPAAIVTAIWGMESNYGRNFGSFRTVDALATLAFDGRRRSWARNELMDALRIVDRGEAAASALIGSWAGAMGHTQFLPSVYLAYAVDADGDGRRDIWGSVPDVVASTAHYLEVAGWRSSEPWGTEVQLPAGFDYARAELSTVQASRDWAGEGVRTPTGAPLPALEKASILAPAGALGPAVLVGGNFRALLRYNNSINYALAVALLAQRIEGGPDLLAPWPRTLAPLTRSEVRSLQQGLNQRGIDAGTADGVIGPATRAGVRQLQTALDLQPADGYPTQALLQRLRTLPEPENGQSSP